MGVRVRGVVKLICPYSVVKGEGIIPRLMVVVLGVIICNRRNGTDIGTQHAEKIDLLLALRDMRILNRPSSNS